MRVTPPLRGATVHQRSVAEDPEYMHATRDPALTPGSGCPQPPALTRSTPQYYATRYPCVSLQVGQDRAQLAGTPVLDVLPAKPDWAEAAAVVGALRRGVAVDTGVLPARSAPGWLDGFPRVGCRGGPRRRRRATGLLDVSTFWQLLVPYISCYREMRMLRRPLP